MTDAMPIQPENSVLGTAASYDKTERLCQEVALRKRGERVGQAPRHASPAPLSPIGFAWLPLRCMLRSLPCWSSANTRHGCNLLSQKKFARLNASVGHLASTLIRWAACLVNDSPEDKTNVGCRKKICIYCGGTNLSTALTS